MKFVRLNAPQGFMLIPTQGLLAAGISAVGLNAPQGFMLIPTGAKSYVGHPATKGLNAPQGFMLIPTIFKHAPQRAKGYSVLMPLRASCSFQPTETNYIDAFYDEGLNAPQGFMLIPTSQGGAA